MLNCRQSHLVHLSKQNIVTSHHRNIMWHPVFQLIQSIQYSKRNHIVETDNCRQIRLFFHKLLSQLISHAIFWIHICHSDVHLLTSLFHNYLWFQTFLFKLFQKTFRPLRPLFLSRRKRRGNISDFFVSQIQKMTRHQTSKLWIIQFHRIQTQFLILIIDDHDRNPLGKTLHHIHKAFTRITHIDNSHRIQARHHL